MPVSDCSRVFTVDGHDSVRWWHSTTATCGRAAARWCARQNGMFYSIMRFLMKKQRCRQSLRRYSVRFCSGLLTSCLSKTLTPAAGKQQRYRGGTSRVACMYPLQRSVYESANCRFTSVGFLFAGNFQPTSHASSAELRKTLINTHE
jgi:hypothetical protein